MTALSADELEERLGSFVADPSGSAVCIDFDGTLSEVVEVPDEAVPIEGVVDLLNGLQQRFGLVAVISGRPLVFLDAVLPGDFARSGLYGLEERIGGIRRVHPDAARWEPIVAGAVAGAVSEAPAGTRVEDKGLSLTVHYRERPEIRDDLETWVRRVADETGLEVRSARMSFELHPPVPVDKGTVVRHLADGYRRVIYLGDDLGDVPAFAALGELAADGVVTLSVVVGGHETPAALADLADTVVDGPAGAIGLLRRLLG